MTEHAREQWVAKPDIVDNDGSWEVHEMLDATRYVLIAYGLSEKTALLIAAGPDLLEALKGVVRVADRTTVEFDAARNAIAKAEGKS